MSCLSRLRDDVSADFVRISDLLGSCQLPYSALPLTRICVVLYRYTTTTTTTTTNNNNNDRPIDLFGCCLVFNNIILFTKELTLYSAKAIRVLKFMKLVGYTGR